MRFSRWCYLAVAAAFVAAVVAPAVANAALTNDYGLTFIGQDTCITCHVTASPTDPSVNIYANTQHTSMVQWGAYPSSTASWPIQGSKVGNTGLTVAQSDIAFTFGDRFELGADVGENGASFDYATYNPTVDKTQNQFKRLNVTFSTVTNLFTIPQTAAGITASTYTCETCHMLGVTQPSSGGNTAVNPNITIPGSTSTINAWAGVSRSNPATSVQSFMPGSSIQCEACHGTGTTSHGAHWSQAAGIVGFGSNPAGMAASTKILDASICGQCHATNDNVAGTLGIVGYTPDQPLTNNVTTRVQVFDPNYPISSPFPGLADSNFYANGSSKSMSHGYYNEWLESGHSFRSQLTSSSPNASWFQKNLGSQFLNTSPQTQTNCLKCHTGEGYLVRKSTTHGVTSSNTATNGIMAGFTLTTSDAGNYGEECAVCHTPHGADGGGVEVRASDTLSDSNPNNDNDSICEDCHNWQIEVLANGTSIPVSGLSVEASTSQLAVRHPQREVLLGKGLLDVAPGTRFMPGAKCEQCHMPQTYGGSAGNYRSHRMLPMLPGNALAWGVPAGGDSCSPCHAGETLTQLQDAIDGWQSDASAAYTVANNALNAAKARHGEYTTAQTNTPAGLDLWGRANVDVQFYAQDGSGGVHNPPYILSGLQKAAQLAKSIDGVLTVTAPKYAVYSQLFGVQGTITNGDGTAAAGVTIKLYRSTDLVHSIGTAVTDENGNYAFSQAEQGQTTFVAVWARSSNALDNRTASVTVRFEKMPTTLTIIRGVSSITHGHSFSLRGELNPEQTGGSTVTVQYKKPKSSTWVTFRTLTTNGDSAYSTTYSTSTKGTWQFRARFAGSAGWLASTSSTVKVLVK